MKKLFFAALIALTLCGCKSKPATVQPVDRTSTSADFPSAQIEDGRAMPAYTPYWKK